MELPADTIAIPAAQEVETMREIVQFTSSPADVFYVPPEVFHKIRNLGEPGGASGSPTSGGGDGGIGGVSPGAENATNSPFAVTIWAGPAAVQNVRLVIPAKPAVSPFSGRV